MRTDPRVLDEIADRVQEAAPRDVYASMLQNGDPADAPRNSQSVKSKKMYERKKAAGASESGSRSNLNFADEIVKVLAMTQTDEFVRGVYVAGNRVPCVMLFSDRQLQEVKAFCFDRRDGSVLAFDKTFNLGSLYVTVATYQNLALNRTASTSSPTFIGPMFVDGQSDVATYNVFFGLLASRLQDTNFSVSHRYLITVVLTLVEESHSVLPLYLLHHFLLLRHFPTLTSEVSQRMPFTLLHNIRFGCNVLQ